MSARHVVHRVSRMEAVAAHRGSLRRGRLMLLLALVAVTAATPSVASAATGYRDFAWAASGVNGPSAEKPQSKLWYNDGIWWGHMFDLSSRTWRIYRLNPTTQTWTDTGTVVDPRAATWADAQWDGSKLYIASAGRSPTNSADSARLYRFSYSSASKTYTLDSGYPTTIVNGGMEAIVIDQDAVGALWATWTRDNQVYANTTGSTGAWGTPFVIPVAGTTVSPDDISSVVSFNGNIGVMWSNQVDEAMYFAVHRNGDPTSTWTSVKKAVQGPKMADDHINLKSLQEINGQVFATVKTSLSDLSSASSPLILLLKRDSTTGNWTNTTVSTVGDDQTRPILMLSPAQDRLWVFSTTPVGGGTINSGTAKTAIYYKTASMSAPSFGAGKGTPFIQTAGDEYINNATSTKQVATAASGVVVLASDNTSGYYQHGVIAPTGTTTAPETTITSGPPATTSSTSATFAFSSSTAGATFTCSLDNAGFTACTSPAPYNGLAAGSHTFAVRATSGGVTDDTPATQTWTVQGTTPPPTSTLTFAPTDDATVDAGLPTTSFGTDTRVTVDSDPQRDFLLKFTVAGTGTGTGCATVTGAKLRLTVGSTANDNADKGGEFRAAVNSNWSESTVTWNTAPASAAGAPVAALTSTTALNTTYVVDVSPLVTGNGTITIRAHGNTTDGTRYFSKDGNSAAVAPQLQVQCS